MPTGRQATAGRHGEAQRKTEAKARKNLVSIPDTKRNVKTRNRNIGTSMNDEKRRPYPGTIKIHGKAEAEAKAMRTRIRGENGRGQAYLPVGRLRPYNSRRAAYGVKELLLCLTERKRVLILAVSSGCSLPCSEREGL